MIQIEYGIEPRAPEHFLPLGEAFKAQPVPDRVSLFLDEIIPNEPQPQALIPADTHASGSYKKELPTIQRRKPAPPLLYIDRPGESVVSLERPKWGPLDERIDADIEALLGRPPAAKLALNFTPTPKNIELVMHIASHIANTCKTVAVIDDRAYTCPPQALDAAAADLARIAKRKRSD